MTESEEKLSQKKCKPCEGVESPLERSEIINYLNALPSWKVTEDDKTLYREFTMKDFMACVDFINKIADIAEEEGHHPDLQLSNYKKLKIKLSTHAIKGLSENDFILASKINRIIFS